MTSPLQDGHFPPDSSDRSATGPLESVSHYSYDSKDVAQHVQERFGRKFNSLNDAYLFPTDETEWSRLDKLHSQFLIAWSGLYPCPDMVEAVLEPAGQESKKILDVGCGTGKWPLEMALKFPHCEVNGIDLSPSPINIASYPPNLHLDILDVNKGLKHLYGQFDLVHARCILTGISNPRKTFEEMQRCLKPGGLLILIDGDINALDVAFHKVKMAKVEGDEDVTSVSEDGAWFQRLVWEAHEASGLAGSDLSGFDLIDDGLWEQPLLDPETAGAGSVYLPIGPWAISSNPKDNEVLQRAGRLLEQNLLQVFQAYHSILRKHGLSQEMLNDWTQRANEEITTLKFPS